MMFQTRSPGTVFTLTGIVGGIIVGLGLYSFYLQSQLSNTRGNLEESRVQVEILTQEKERTERALTRLVAETSIIRQELSDARERVRDNEEFQEWAPNRLPQILIDELSRPK